MKKNILVAIKMVIITLIITGVIYPLIITVLAQVMFPKQANGSLIKKDGQTIGSTLIGQQFSKPQFFHPRPSAAGNGYDPTASGGSNLGPTSKKLIANIKDNIAKVKEENPNIKGNVPVDMVTTSASGLDPDISVENAYLQIPRVAKARNINEKDLKKLVNKNITGRQFGILGERRVSVLNLNLALDSLK